eukprot:468213_1
MSENRLTWTDANNYCINHCSSTLVTFHNKTKYIQIINHTIPNSINISSAFSDYWGNSGYWIGLNNIYTTKLQWSDGTQMDYGWGGTTYSSPPWEPGEPSYSWGENCVHMWDTKGYKWNDVSCSANMRFICNICKGKLEKYLLIQQLSTWSNAQSFCSTNIGTSLASIHSKEDQDDIRALCSSNSAHCWIGLSDINEQGTYVWVDETTFDYGTNPTGGVTPGMDPWGNTPDNEPNGGSSENCIQAHSDKGFRWNDESCASNAYFICNMPSEICFENNWKIIQNSGDTSWNNCEMNSTFNSIAIIDKQWIYSNDLWVIEYMHTVHKLVDVYGQSGITIHHFDFICDYYYVGIAINGTYAYLFIYSYINGIETEIFYSNPLFVYEFERYYMIKIELSYTDKLVWNVTINDIQYINGVTSHNITYLNHHKYVGIETRNVDVTAKSLFISETLQYISNDFDLDNLWSQCIMRSTTTTATTTTSTSDAPLPTPNDILITYGVTITISFQYDLNNSSLNISEINSILIAITEKIIENEIDNVDICTDSNNYNISVVQTEVTTITARVLVCNQDDQNILIAQFDTNLHTEFINEFNKDKNILIDKTSIDLDVDTIYKHNIETSIIVTDINYINDNEDGNKFILTIILILVLFVLCVICALLGYKTYKLKGKRISKRNSDMIASQLHLTQLHLTQLQIPSCSPTMTGAYTKTISEIFDAMNDGKSPEIISSDSKMMISVINTKNMIINEDIDSENELEFKSELVVTNTVTSEDNKQNENDIENDIDEKLDWTPGLQFVTMSNDNMDRYEIRQWLDIIDLSQYENNFIENGYESMNFIKEITTITQLNDIGIDNIEHQNKIISNLKTLCNNTQQIENNVQTPFGDDDIVTKGNDEIITKGNDNNEFKTKGNDKIETKGNINVIKR